ncbi:pentapeptide repeat-containing protein [Pleurocapsa sp. PCC 7319]|uniref:pentapeptide repeat-containing protein n=1 Tax=Pleurocapsa sp. PCC 7319 TaxID=118161 RepID=UPI000A00EE1A
MSIFSSYLSRSKDNKVEYAALDKFNLTDVDLSGSNLTRACLSGAKFQKTNMRRVDFLYADISQTPFFSAFNY